MAGPQPCVQNSQQGCFVATPRRLDRLDRLPPVSREAPINTVLVSASAYSLKMLFRAMIRLETQGPFEGGVVESTLTDSSSWVHPDPILCLVDDDRDLAAFGSFNGLSVIQCPSSERTWD